MSSVEDLLGELATEVSTEAGADFDPDLLRAAADRRRRHRRLLTSVGACGLGVIAVTALLAFLGGRGPQRVDTIGEGPAPVDGEDRDDTSKTSQAPTPAPASEDEQPVEDGDQTRQYELSPEHAGRAMDAVDRFLAALAVGDHETAAEWWAPDPDLVVDPPSEGQAEVEALRNLCDRSGCSDGYRILGARGSSDDERLRAEVFLDGPGPGGSPFTLWVEADHPTAPETIWRIRSEPPSRAGGEEGLLQALFPAGLPDRVAVARQDGIDAMIDGRLVRTDPGNPIDSWIRNGWVHAEGRWIDATDPTRVCDYSTSEPSGQGGVVAIDIFALNGRWVAEILPMGDDEGGPTEPSVFFDCERGTIDPSLADLGSTYPSHGNIDNRLFSADGQWIQYRADASACCDLSNSRVVTSDGRELALVEDSGAGQTVRWAEQVTYHSQTETVAYLAVESPEPGADSADQSLTLEVRSLTSGDVVHRMEVAERGTLTFDGRYLAHSAGRGTVGPMDGTLHTPGGRVLVLDVGTGTWHTVPVWSTTVHLG